MPHLILGAHSSRPERPIQAPSDFLDDFGHWLELILPNHLLDPTQWAYTGIEPNKTVSALTESDRCGTHQDNCPTPAERTKRTLDSLI